MPLAPSLSTIFSDAEAETTRPYLHDIGIGSDYSYPRPRYSSRTHFPPPSGVVPGVIQPPYPGRRSYDSIGIAPSNHPHHYPASHISYQTPINLTRPPTRTSAPQEPYVPINPFHSHVSQSSSSEKEPSLLLPSSRVSYVDSPLPLPATISVPLHLTASGSRLFSLDRINQAFKSLNLFLFDALPRQIYLHVLLRVPSIYFTRVTRVFEDAELSMPDIKDMVNADDPDIYQANWYVYSRPGAAVPMSPALARFKISWEDFISSLMSEWQSQNIIAVLLLSAVLTMLQIGGIEGDPISRTGALLSLVCALMSLLYGSIYMTRFGTMNKMYKAASWAEEARNTRTLIWWNVWVFLAMPAVWLAWSIIFFSASVLCFVWRTGSTQDSDGPIRLQPRQELGPRVAVSFIFALGFLYFLLILQTLKRYGSSMDRHWRTKMRTWKPEEAPVVVLPAWLDTPSSPALVRGPYQTAIESEERRPYAFSEVLSRDQERFDVISTVKFMDLNNPGDDHDRPSIFSSRISDTACAEFRQHTIQIWEGSFVVPNVLQEDILNLRSLLVQDLIDTWNTWYFRRRDLKLTLAPPDSPSDRLSIDEFRPTDVTQSTVIYLSAARSEPRYTPSPSLSTTSDVSTRLSAEYAISDIPVLMPSNLVDTHNTPVLVPSNSVDTHGAPVPITSSSVYPPNALVPVTSNSVDTPNAPVPITSNSVDTTDAPIPIPSNTVDTPDVTAPAPSSSVNTHDVSVPSDVTGLKREIYPFLADPLHYQDAPGPYRKALERSSSFPEAFYRRVLRWNDANNRMMDKLKQFGASTDRVPESLDITTIWHAEWQRFTCDLRLVLAGKFPIPSLSPSDCLKMRHLIVDDLLDIWNTRFFLQRGVRVVLTLDDINGTNTSPTDETYGSVPYVIHLNPAHFGMKDYGMQDQR